MPKYNYDVIVIGLGGMGSAAIYNLAKAGKRVFGIEQFSNLHSNGSSHGKSRIVRHGYFSNRDTYMPLLLRAKELWNLLEEETNIKIQYQHDGLSLGREDSLFIQGSLLCAKEYGLEIEKIESNELKKRYPQFQAPEDFIAVLDKTAYTLDPEAAITAHLQLAEHYGAEFHYNEQVIAWAVNPTDSSVIVTTDKGSYSANKIILTAGPWTNKLTNSQFPFNVQRTVSYWFEPISTPGNFDSEKLPNYIWYFDDNNIFYGFPHMGEYGKGIKIGLHFQRTDTDPNEIERSISDSEIDAMRTFLKQYIPTLAGDCIYAETCMYTMTPDENFIVGFHPTSDQVIIAGGFSGHGYRFVSVMGEILSDLAINGQTVHSIKLFSPSRFFAEF